MVLQEATDFDSPERQGDFQQDAANFPDAGPGKTVIQIQDERYAVDTASLPKPFPFIKSQDWGQRPELTSAVAVTLVQARTLLGRPLKQGEVDAMAQTFAKSMQFMSYSLPTSLLAGGLMAYRGREEFKVPFLQLSKREWFNPEKLGPFRGTTARLAWHTIRFGAWQGWCLALAGLFFGSMARTSTMNSIMTDPRMQAIRDARAKAMERGSSGLPERPGPRQNSSIESQQGRMDNQAMRAENMWRRGRKDQRASSDDDMSPTGGAFASEMSNRGDEGMLSDQDIQRNEQRQQLDQERYTQDQHRAQGPQEQQGRSQPQSRQQSQQPQQPSSSPPATGSAWERLRRQATSGQSGGAPAPRSTESQAGNDYTFSQQFEDRQLAHDEAQKEFDARIERERRGGDFDSGKSNKRW